MVDELASTGRLCAALVSVDCDAEHVQQRAAVFRKIRDKDSNQVTLGEAASPGSLDLTADP